MNEAKPLSLSEVSDIKISNVDKKSVVGEVDVILCNYMDVYSNDYIAQHLDFMPATASQVEVEKFKVESGDVLITKDSETPYDIGIPSVVVDNIEGLVCAYHLALIKPDRSRVDSIFLGKQLAHPDAARYFSRFAAGSTRYGLPTKAIANTPVSLPSISVQRRIARILQTIDQSMEKTEALIDKYQQIKAGLMHDLFTRGIGPDGQLRPPREQAPELYQETPIGWIPKEWEYKRLDAVATVDRGKFTARPRNDPKYYGEGYPFIQTGDVTGNLGRFLYTYSQSLNEKGATVSKSFPVSTIMVTIAANIADTCLLGVPMYAPDSVVGVIAQDEEDSRYIERCINRKKGWLYAIAPQSAQRNINLEDLRPLLIPWPEKAERLKISEDYRAIENRIFILEEELGKIRKIKSGLMHDLLTGAVQAEPETEPEAAYV